ncbi:MAG TPA: universal stress protein [Acidimicrobiales bacterium]|nr:universal stress protein [Acidimicrobiales bacterium]
MSDATQRRVVVGLDGSETSKSALEWAIIEAKALDAVLVLFNAWMVPMAVAPGYVGFWPDLEKVATEILADAETRVAEVAPGLVVETMAVEEPPAPALVAISESADLLVVGSRGLGGFKELLLGSVSHFCVTHAHCPVLVVRPAPKQASD